ncbi:MAG: lactate utilization protein [Desulfobacterales bacterium]|nr:MAG: lactate utilization protein [Desulfobacterales bacterium]
MVEPIERYWNTRLADVKEALNANNFDAVVVSNAAEAKTRVLEKIIPETAAKSISWGGSMTFITAGIYDAIKERSDVKVLDTFAKELAAEDMLERRRQSLLVDLFLTGSNAVTETGQLVNLDMVGNRVGAITFGPKHVVILVGRNKIVTDLDEAMFRIKNYAAPVNVMRLSKKTPCSKTSYCEECNSPDRICNTWTITEKSFPKGRVKVVLINEDMGF